MNGKFNIDPEKVAAACFEQGLKDRELFAKSIPTIYEVGDKRVQFLPAISKEDLPKRIHNFVAALPLEKQEELVSIGNSLAYFGAAEAIRWVFFPEASEDLVREQIEMTSAKELEDKEIF